MKILVVEDDYKIRVFLKKSLEAECFSVDAVDDGLEGYQLGQINNYDFIILDNMLPRISGLEICTHLRNEGKSTPILILSVQSDTDMKVRALDAGADDYLTKPFSLQELIARIRALMRRPSQITDEVITVGEITLDTRRHIVTHGNKEIRLTKKEFMLLEYLMSNPGIVLSRGMIMEHVWDMNADPFSNTIESHILSLRKKIGGENKTEYIQTIPGRGYKIA